MEKIQKFHFSGVKETYKPLKPSLWEKIMILFGRSYLVNHNTKEIHRLKLKHVNCHTELIAKKSYISLYEALRLMRQEKYNGCRWCYKEFNKE